MKEGLTFDDINIETRKFHNWKQWVNIKYVHIGKILISTKISFNKTCFKYFIGYKDHKKVKSLYIIFRKINLYKDSLDET